ncbi:MAG TPA: hypothetical protein VGF94_13330 [Kofleriaceae bacterium]
MRRDHDDLDRALVIMVDEATRPDDLAVMLDVFRLALAVHVAAEATVFEVLLARIDGPRALTMLVAQARDEHGAQYHAAERPAKARPASIDWYSRALELRVLVLDHAARAELTRWTLQEHVPVAIHRALASGYATERMRVLGRTSPMQVAEAQLAQLTVAR